MFQLTYVAAIQPTSEGTRCLANTTTLSKHAKLHVVKKIGAAHITRPARAFSRLMEPIPNSGTLLTHTASALPMAVASINHIGISLPDLVQLTTLIYTSLLILHKLWRMGREWRSQRKTRESD